METPFLARLLALACLLTALAAAPSAAHDLSHSQSTTTVSGRQASVRLQLDLVGLANLRWQADRVVSYDELDLRVEEVFGLIKEHFGLTTSSALVNSTLARYELQDGHVLGADILFTFQRDIEALVVRSTFDRIAAADHQHVATVTFNGATTAAILTARSPVATFEGQGARWALAWDMARAGAVRVLAGVDALLFLLLLMITKPTMKSLGFALGATVAAHIAGVAWAVLSGTPLSPAWWPTLSPMLVVALALANLLGGHQLDRLVIVSAMALVQTLVHADALRTSAMPTWSLAIASAMFSLGLTLAQIAVVAAALPLTRVITAPHWRYVRPTVSVAVAGLAVYWILERSL